MWNKNRKKVTAPVCKKLGPDHLLGKKPPLLGKKREIACPEKLCIVERSWLLRMPCGGKKGEYKANLTTLRLSRKKPNCLVGPHKGRKSSTDQEKLQE